MKLQVIERLTLPTILPKEGDFKTLTIKQDIIDKVKISQEEMKALEFIVNGDNYKWNDKKDKGVEVVFSEMELDLIKNQLSALDKSKKLDDNTLPIYKLFN